MGYLLVVVAVVASVVCVVAGLILTSKPALLAAAILSAISVLLIRRYRAQHHRTFVTDPPSRVAPNWDRPLKISVGDSSQRAGQAVLPDIAIDGYHELLAAEVFPALETLSVEELRDVLARERRGLARSVVLERAQRLIDLTELSNALHPSGLAAASKAKSSTGPSPSKPRPKKVAENKTGLTL